MSGRNFQQVFDTHRRKIEKRLIPLMDGKEPVSLYKPIAYVLSGGGKRIRSVLVLLSCEAAGGRPETALDAAVAVELLHNFTLVHDDVMDHAELRRGKRTVHRQWDVETAILSGDEIIAKAYEFILRSKTPRLRDVLTTFTDAFVTVCEGQGYDKEFERRVNVSVDEYMEMIERKTARLISGAMEIGGILGGADEAGIRGLRAFGKHLGLAFQISDDLLDSVGDEEVTGKTIGSDILEGKKTIMLIKAMERARGKDLRLLNAVARRRVIGETTVQRVLELYEKYDVAGDAMWEIRRHTGKAQKALSVLPDSRARRTLSSLAVELLGRTK